MKELLGYPVVETDDLPNLKDGDIIMGTLDDLIKETIMKEAVESMVMTEVKDGFLLMKTEGSVRLYSRQVQDLIESLISDLEAIDPIRAERFGRRRSL